jgi:hypothetical protein
MCRFSIARRGIFVITPSISPVLAGAAAGGALVLIDRVFPGELEEIEQQAMGIAVVGLGLAACTTPGQQGAAQNYWIVAAVAGVPVVLNWWSRRKAARAIAVAQRGVDIVKKDYRNGGAASA